MQALDRQIPPPAEAQRFFEDKLAFTIGPVELERWIKSGEDNLVVVDVRAAEDFAKGHVLGAINIPMEQWDKPEGLSKQKMNVLYCYTQQCHLAATACARFAGLGYPVMELEGGFETWKDNELEVEEESTHRYQSTARHLGSGLRR